MTHAGIFAFSWIGWLVLAASCATAEARTLLPLSACNKIGLQSEDGWLAEVYSDGSAQLVYGSSVGDGASAPKGSVDFRLMYNRLADRVKPDGNLGGDHRTVAVFFTRGDYSSTAYAWYLRDQRLIAEIFLELKSKSIPNPMFASRFHELLANHPLPPN